MNGRELDTDTKLTYFRARWYDDAIGCFIGEDPSGFSAGDVNLTRYVHNDPVNFRDPSGLQEMGGYQWDDAKSYAENYKAQMEHDRARIDETIERNRPLQEAAQKNYEARLAHQQYLKEQLDLATDDSGGYSNGYTRFVGEWVARPAMGDNFLVTASDTDLIGATVALAGTTVLSVYGGWYATRWIGHVAKGFAGPFTAGGAKLTTAGAAIIGGAIGGTDYLAFRGSLNYLNPDADDPTLSGTALSVAAGAGFGIFGNYLDDVIGKYAGSFGKYFGRGADDVVAPVRQNLGHGHSSKILGENIEAVSGVTRPANSAAHHLVAGSDKRAAQARAILQREGIDINEAANGVFLPRNSGVARPPATTHSRVHTDRYYDAVNQRLRNAAPGAVRQELDRIAQELQSGTFPY